MLWNTYYLYINECLQQRVIYVFFLVLSRDGYVSLRNKTSILSLLQDCIMDAYNCRTERKNQIGVLSI